MPPRPFASTAARLAGLLLLAAATAACAAPATVARPASAAAPCRWPSAPEVLHQAGDTLVQRWTAPASALPDAWAPDALPALRDYRAFVAATLGVTDARALLRRQADHWAAQPDVPARREADNGRALLDGRVGALRPIACLEALLLDAQAARVPMATRPTELQALVLRRAAAGGEPARLRVYVAASAAPWPPKLTPAVDSMIARDRRDGWTVHAHLHNHPFYPDRRAADVAGANAPSLSDVQYYRALRARLGLEEAWVTNGFTTAVIPARDFARLSAHE